MGVQTRAIVSESVRQLIPIYGQEFFCKHFFFFIYLNFFVKWISQLIPGDERRGIYKKKYTCILNTLQKKWIQIWDNLQN